MTRMIPKSKDFWGGVSFMLLAAAALYFGSNLSMGTAMRMGPRYFPTLVACCLLVIGAYVAFHGLSAEAEKVGKMAARPALILLGVLLFAFLLKPLGFIAATGVLIIVSSLAAPNLKLIETLALAVVLTAFSWAVFVLGLGLPLPAWPA